MAEEKKPVETAEKKEITPSQYFEILKDAKQVITTEELKDSYDIFIAQAKKYKKAGQKKASDKLMFLANTLKNEEKLIEMGINTFIYKDVLEDYITTVASKTVKIVEVAGYMREIPDELIDVIDKTKDIFDEFYVVFTDYTGKEERKVEKERRDKDPILFGVFKDRTTVADRFYFLGDWVDEYCDLTLDKLIDEYRNKKGKNPTHTTKIPQTSEELLEILDTYKIDTKKGEGEIVFSQGTVPIQTSHFKVSDEEGEGKKPWLLTKIRSIFKK